MEVSMNRKHPPVPRENQTDKGPGGSPDVPLDNAPDPETAPNLKQKGRHGDIYQNTHNVGYQQDR
jgi:hypothetical protein